MNRYLYSGQAAIHWGNLIRELELRTGLTIIQPCGVSEDYHVWRVAAESTTPTVDVCCAHDALLCGALKADPERTVALLSARIKDKFEWETVQLGA